METKKVWFVTGASKGLGLTLVKKLIATGAKVAATSRKLADLESAVQGENENFLPIEADITDESGAARAIEATITSFGRIDAVVNNAGYALTGSLEELSDAEVRRNFDVNVFGTLHVIRHALPHLRQQRSGHIFNISSIGGYLGNFAGFGSYCASKFAVVGLTEALVEEVKPFGINVTLVAPGYFRTEFLTAGSLAGPAREIDDYQNVRDVERAHQLDISGNQPGDPEKAAELFIEAASHPTPPTTLFLGRDAYELITGKLATLGSEVETWKEWTVNTGFENA